jgi:RNA polymerase sigma-70 factor (ECF subfamily)
MLSDGATQDRDAADIPAQGPLPPDQVAEFQALRLIYEVLDRMSERSRTLFILFELEELTGQEIAELQGAKVATVWVWLHRARAEFRRHLGDLQGSAPEALGLLR